jgi:hypothetical protein
MSMNSGMTVEVNAAVGRPQVIPAQFGTAYT